MFVDNECATFLGESPLRDEVKLKARIFSLNSAEDFLTYLAEIELRTPDDVRATARSIYGLR